ncbi:hypothetical protein B0T16DRAFT_105406 [Cercophora newfieldiana]|uniref:Uncharacterized protein n=1 Tax=Cercophora newfieldiana TaxID=92897 RepID=A0AA40CXF1_9PEZI|nr:hypothetical protein B0T16DRAFT_105406 [Cercophora newfieldiana]
MEEKHGWSYQRSKSNGGRLSTLTSAHAPSSGFGPLETEFTDVNMPDIFRFAHPMIDQRFPLRQSKDSALGQEELDHKLSGGGSGVVRSSAIPIGTTSKDNAVADEQQETVTPKFIDSATASPETSDRSSNAGSEAPSVFTTDDDSMTVASSVMPASANTNTSTMQLLVEELFDILLRHDELIPLYKNAIKRVTERKFENHIRGFLNAYGHDLRAEAQTGVQVRTAAFVRKSARQIVGMIRREVSIGGRPLEHEGAAAAIISRKRQVNQWLEELSRNNTNTQEQREDDDTDYDEVEEVEEEGEDDDEEDHFHQLDETRAFLISSQAFRALIQSIRDWLSIKAERKGLDVGVGEAHGHDAEEERENSGKELRSQLFPTLAAETPKIRTTGTTGLQKLASVDIAEEGSYAARDIHPGTEKVELRSEERCCAEKQGGGSGVAALATTAALLMLSLGRRIWEPRLQPGHQRLRWKCLKL